MYLAAVFGSQPVERKNIDTKASLVLDGRLGDL